MVFCDQIKLVLQHVFIVEDPDFHPTVRSVESVVLHEIGSLFGTEALKVAYAFMAPWLARAARAIYSEQGAETLAFVVSLVKRRSLIAPSQLNSPNTRGVEQWFREASGTLRALALQFPEEQDNQTCELAAVFLETMYAGMTVDREYTGRNKDERWQVDVTLLARLEAFSTTKSWSRHISDELFFFLYKGWAQ